jgi:hypothetical protein
MVTTTPIYLEIGTKRIFACALDWPGWARSGKTEEDAIEALAEYESRYAPIANVAGIAFHVTDFRVVEKIPGSATTDFGAPGGIPDADHAPLTTAKRKRIAGLVSAAWTVLDKAVDATPPELRKGPRGGGRDRDKMVDHVLGAESVFARKIGVKHKQPALGDQVAITELREDILAALAGPAMDTPWPAPYAARRIAWHALDHAWEMEDKRPS